MSGFTKAIRQRIVEEFARRHGGSYNAAAFVEEVRKVGPKHPAYGWFEWNSNRAALLYQIEQARDFARDLRVTFSVVVVNNGRRSVQVRETALPLVLSPMDGRQTGGGYVLTDPDDPAHLAEHRRQAATALRSWWSRYQSAAVQAGCSTDTVEDIILKLEAPSNATDEAA
ncbi:MULTISPECIES: hypothetical protein [unclassified Methylobacterium]|uniref:hypothetical protein n=1 Tax=unclassified Methylobacterium TaxID=2615210 RepID=UPI00226AA0F6|nr:MULTISPECIES: hypothetical protein [unclassified Methylobacterium]